jgi:phage/plasmid-like protein (TIGR03299 family)
MPAEFESGVFAGGKPAWHGLGVTLPSEALDAAEALQYSGLANWRLAKQPIFVQGPNGYSPVQDRFAVVRETDAKPLGVVGPGYDIVQNEEAFSFMDALLGGEGFHYETAGSLRGGSVVWLLAKPPFELDLPGGKAIPFVLLRNTHDGSAAMRAAATPVRVVCWNTLTAALGSASASISLRHTRNVRERMAQAREVLGLAEGAAIRMEQSAARLAAVRFDDLAVSGFWHALFPDATNPTAQTRVETHRSEISDIYHGSALGQDAVRGTAWGVFQAVTAYHDHTIAANSRGAKRPAAEKRFERIMDRAALPARAYRLLAPSGA